MCIIVYKKEDVSPPTDEILSRQFDNNPDGCGYMFTDATGVHIRKGFMTIKDFLDDYHSIIKRIGDKAPMVFHFRISTQCGVTPKFTHPFPYTIGDNTLISSPYVQCKLGVVHNGIIHLTSKTTTDYSDTSKFVTDYLPLIIKNNIYDFYKDPKTILLIQRLIDGSRMCFLDSKGHATLIGNFIEDKTTGLMFSNSTYNTTKYTFYSSDCYYSKYSTPKKATTLSILSAIEAKEKYKMCKDEEENIYYFLPGKFCPKLDGNPGYCSHCAYKEDCDEFVKRLPKQIS